MNSNIGQIVGVAALGVVALLVAKNWGTLQQIGTGVSSKVTSGLNSVASAVTDASKE